MILGGTLSNNPGSPILLVGHGGVPSIQVRQHASMADGAYTLAMLITTLPCSLCHALLTTAAE